MVNGADTNICLGRPEDGKVHAAAPIIDALESDPQRRFKMLYWHEYEGVADATNRIADSPDGRRWTVRPNPILVGDISQRTLGDVIVLPADVTTGEYHLDTRLRGMCEFPGPWIDAPRVVGWGLPLYGGDLKRDTRRRIFTTYTRDLNNWAPLRELLRPDPIEDNLDDEYYGMARFRMGDL